MGTTHDKKIKDLLSAVEKKRTDLGIKPKPIWKTNGIINNSNINTLNTVDRCVEIAVGLIQELDFTAQACEFLGVTDQDNDRAEYLKDALDDLKLRVSMVKWEIEKKKLTAMEKKLKDLRSEDLKTEDELANMESDLSS
jgi:hypothetical protein